MRKIILNEQLKFEDTLGQHKPGLWVKTEVVGGYGDYKFNPTGKSTIGEVVFREKNVVPIGGVSYAMQNLFGVKDEQIDIPTLYSSNGIGKINSGEPIETYMTPNGEKSVVYRYGHYVQLFGVGITGTAENDVTVYHPDYRENNIYLSRVNNDGLTITGTMLPFRYTPATLDSNDRKKYFGKKLDEEGITCYYLKRFEADPVIKHVWKTGEEIDHEELVSDADVWENSTGKNSVETFTEMHLVIDKSEIKEWFISLEQEDRTRINTIALFSGQFVAGDDASDYGDYRDVRLFSKLCMKPEYLDQNKDLHIIYRVYGS